MPGSRAWISEDFIPGCSKFCKDFDGKAYLNVLDLEVFDICLDLPNNWEK